MKASPPKYHSLANNNKERFQIRIGNKTFTNGKFEKLLKLLRVKINHQLNSNEHVALY